RRVMMRRSTSYLIGRPTLGPRSLDVREQPLGECADESAIGFGALLGPGVRIVLRRPDVVPSGRCSCRAVLRSVRGALVILPAPKYRTGY
ncbi:MAG: hypothetical protein ACR2F6_00230, partial [Mycobacteriales bacterium]